jgi:cardiolipin synthase
MTELIEALEVSWPYVFGLFELFAALAATAHCVLRKDNVSSAIGWVGLIWLAPVVGPVLYVMLGVNRVSRAARDGRRGRTLRVAPRVARAPQPTAPDVEAVFGAHAALSPFMGVARVDNAFALSAGNAVDVLVDGDAAYPAMLAAIRGARRSVLLTTYIFDHDEAGLQFADALAAANQRGVEVRVIIDAVGARYSAPSMVRTLRRRGVPVATFMPSWVPWAMPYWNLRNHRKLLVVDGSEGFAGGMNIRAGCLLSPPRANPTRDLHFALRGPVVRHLAQVFTEDWAFATGEVLDDPAFALETAVAGDVLARGVPDGPDYDLERLLWKRLAFVSQATRSVRIVSPYFLPETRLLAALRLAAMRGVDVQIVMPAVNNLRFVAWAAMHQLGPLLEAGCALYFSAPPFDHSKLFVVDEVAVMVGSANWDARSHRLNFEFDVECYDPQLAATVGAQVDERVASARRLTLADYRQRALPQRLRDGCAWLLSPYL